MKKVWILVLAMMLALTGGCVAAGSNGGNKVSNPTAIMETNQGTIEIELYLDKTPVTAQNFIDLSKKGFYDESYQMKNDITGHITLLGVEVGNKHLIGFGEFGVGALGLFRGGIGYRF